MMTTLLQVADPDDVPDPAPAAHPPALPEPAGCAAPRWPPPQSPPRQGLSGTERGLVFTFTIMNCNFKRAWSFCYNFFC